MQQFYAENPQERSFDYYVDWHLRRAFVFSTQDYFVMGSPVPSRRFNPHAPSLVSYAKDECDAWYIFAASGRLPKLWEIMPWPLPKIGWERIREGKRELKFFSADTLMRLCPPENETHSLSSH